LDCGALKTRRGESVGEGRDGGRLVVVAGGTYEVVVRGERVRKAAGECAGEEAAVKEEDMGEPNPDSEPV
jgi:hypothetical protein